MLESGPKIENKINKKVTGLGFLNSRPDQNIFFDGLHASLYFKKDLTDAEINSFKVKTENIAHNSKDKKVNINRLAKQAEYLPAYFSEFLKEEITGLNFLKTDQFIDVEKGVDIIMSLDDFKQVLLLDVTINPEKKNSSTSFLESVNSNEILNKREINNLYNMNTHRLMRINLFVNSKEMQEYFSHLLKDNNLNKKEIYFLVVKKFYIDKIVKLLCMELSDGKLAKIEDVIKAVSIVNKNPNKNININTMPPIKLSLLDILLRLNVSFYNSEIYFNLKKQRFLE